MSGEVAEVQATPLTPMKKGDVLFTIDPRPYQAEVDRLRASLAKAEQTVPQLEAAFEAAKATAQQAVADRDLAKFDYDVAADIATEDARAISERTVERAEQTLRAAEAALRTAKANERRGRLAFESEIDGVNTTVAEIRAQLAAAELDLDWTTVRAPTDGYVVGLTLLPGQRVANLPLRSWMAYVNAERSHVVVGVNPAGMTGVKSTAVAVGVGAAFPVAEFDVRLASAGGDDGGNAGVNAVFPAAYAVKPIDRLRLGLSILSPSGAVTGTGVDYGDRFVGRYGAIDAKLSSIMFAPALAYEFNDALSVGVGGGALYTKFDQTIALNTPGADGRADFDGLDGWAGMFFAGLTYKLGPATTLGVTYRSQADVDIGGRVSFSNLPVQAPDVDVDAKWQNSQMLQLGLTHAFSPKWIVTADVWWEDWSAFGRNRFEVEFQNNTTNVQILDRNFKDVYGGGLAVTHIAGPNIINVGVSYDSSPVNDGDRTVDLPLDSILALSFGFAHNASKGLTYAIGGSALINGDGQEDQTAQNVRFAGEFDTNVVFLVGGSIQWRF